MQIGHLRVSRDHAKKKWAIQGRKNGKWINCFDEERIDRFGIDKWLLFDLKYDACGALLAYVEIMEEIDKKQNTSSYKKRKSPLQTMISNDNRIEKQLRQRKIKRKMVKQSRRKNRK